MNQSPPLCFASWLTLAWQRIESRWGHIWLLPVSLRGLHHAVVPLPHWFTHSMGTFCLSILVWFIYATFLLSTMWAFKASLWPSAFIMFLSKSDGDSQVHLHLQKAGQCMFAEHVLPILRFNLLHRMKHTLPSY